MTIEQLQETIKKFVHDRQIGTSVENRMLDLVSEAGELGKEVLKSSNYGKRSFHTTKAFKDELGDVFFSLVCLANQTDLNLDQLMKDALVKYDQRFKEHNHIGSVNKNKG